MDGLRDECAAGDEVACGIWRSAEGAVSKDLAGKRVAVIGSGPASLTCAGELAKRGCDITVFEALHKVGGVLTYGIPEFRLPKDLVQREVSKLGDKGVSFEVNALVGKLYDIDELMEDRGFDAVFVGTGAGLPSYLGIEGEGLNGVSVASELLTRVNLMKAYLFPEYETPVYAGKKCVVVGGGNVAMDAARTAKRLGADVTVVYRRGRDEMPARAEEVHHAEQEGIHFQLLTNPTRILGDENGWASGVECVRMELGEPDASGRRRPTAVEGSEFVIDIDHLSSPEEAICWRDTLFADERLRPDLSFVSPSTTGIKLLVPYRLSIKKTVEESFDEAVRFAWEYLEWKYGLKADATNADLSRACFLCHDPSARLGDRNC